MTPGRPPSTANVLKVEIAALGSCASETTRICTCIAVRGQIDDDITAPPAVEKMHMGIVRQHLRNRIVWRAV